jgi:EAL domain-containing protein (putative c-di-GMP-specific phosphodiesterase class I)
VHGKIAPGHFISVAEDTGLIVPIGEWVLHKACEQARHWRASDRPLGISVNVSGRQLREGDLLGIVRDAMARNGIGPGQLTLEITELALVDGSPATRDRLHRIDELGVRLAIDDFGSGYSSMSYLRRLPVRTLKIDRSLVHGVPGDRDGEAIVEAIVAMCRSLSLGIIAEGVETLAQASYLSRYKPITVQGFHFGLPLPADEVAALLNRAGGTIAASTHDSH